MSLTAFEQIDSGTELLAKIGDISGFEVYNNQVLIAVYKGPERTKGGIYRAEQSKEEANWQSKVGLIVAIGNQAFVDADGRWFKDADIAVHDWILFNPSDGWGMKVNGVMCRMLYDTSVRAKLADPDMVY